MPQSERKPVNAQPIGIVKVASFMLKFIALDFPSLALRDLSYCYADVTASHALPL
jgi:hypothetical protein